MEVHLSTFVNHVFQEPLSVSPIGKIVTIRLLLPIHFWWIIIQVFWTWSQSIIPWVFLFSSNVTHDLSRFKSAEGLFNTDYGEWIILRSTNSYRRQFIHVHWTSDEQCGGTMNIGLFCDIMKSFLCKSGRVSYSLRLTHDWLLNLMYLSSDAFTEVFTWAAEWRCYLALRRDFRLNYNLWCHRPSKCRYLENYTYMF